MHSKMDDPHGSHSTHFESFLIVSTKTGKKIFENQCQTSFNVGLECRLNNMREPLVCLPLECRQETLLGISNATNRQCQLLNSFEQTGNVADRPRLGKPRKTTPREDRFLTTSSRRNRFLSSRKLGHLQRNATGTRVCDRTVRNRLHAARLKACRT